MHVKLGNVSFRFCVNKEIQYIFIYRMYIFPMAEEESIH